MYSAAQAQQLRDDMYVIMDEYLESMKNSLTFGDSEMAIFKQDVNAAIVSGLIYLGKRTNL